VLLGAEINSVLEDAAAESGEPDAKLKGEKAPGDRKAATPRTQCALGQDHRTAHP
jgi:hypothetical protein